MYRGTVSLWIFMARTSRPTQCRGVCNGISESPAALSDDTHFPPIDERRGITSKARDQPPTPFLDTISPGFGVLSCRWRGPESRSFPQVGFSPRDRIHLPPAEKFVCEPDASISDRRHASSLLPVLRPNYDSAWRTGAVPPARCLVYQAKGQARGGRSGTSWLHCFVRVRSAGTQSSLAAQPSLITETVRRT